MQRTYKGIEMVVCRTAAVHLYSNYQKLTNIKINIYDKWQFIPTINPNNSHVLQRINISSKMEDPQNKAQINIQGELRNLTELEARIEQTRKSLNQLTKLESNQARHLQTIYRWSDSTTRNKLNLFENHQLVNKKKEQESEELSRKHEKVKDMKEREERELRQIKNLLRQNKENQRSIIRNNSLLHDEAIKKNRKLELQKKEKLVNQIKKQKQSYKVALADSRIEQKKKKEIEALNKTFAKIQKLPMLMKQLQKLSKQKQEVERRLEQRKQHKQKMKAEIIKIQKMKEDQVILSLSQSYSDGKKKLFIEKSVLTLNAASIERGHQTLLSPILNSKYLDVNKK